MDGEPEPGSLATALDRATGTVLVGLGLRVAAEQLA